MQSGYFAAVTFLVFTGGGSIAQVSKLLKRRRAWQAGHLAEKDICAGLRPTRELWAFSAISLFAFSGITRSYIDYVLVGTRIPVAILGTGILAILSKHQPGIATRYFRTALGIDALLLFTLALVWGGISLDGTLFALGIDAALSCIGVLLFYGKCMQARAMYRMKQTGAVSWLREAGCALKDIAGLWYTIQVGSELRWVGLTHALSGLSSILICLAKAVVERKQTPSIPPQSKPSPT